MSERTARQALLDQIDYTSLAFTPLEWPTKPYCRREIYGELRQVFDRYKRDFFVSPPRNAHVIPLLVPGGDWRDTNAFLTENADKWSAPEWTELAEQCPYTVEMLKDCYLRWNTLIPRIVVISPFDDRGFIPHRGAWTQEPDKALKLRFHTNGDDRGMHFIRRDGSTVSPDQACGYYLINGNVAHYAKWDGNEATRRFNITGGIPAKYSDEFLRHILLSLEKNRDKVIRLPLEDQDTSKYDWTSTGKLMSGGFQEAAKDAQ